MTNKKPDGEEKEYLEAGVFMCVCVTYMSVVFVLYM